MSTETKGKKMKKNNCAASAAGCAEDLLTCDLPRKQKNQWTSIENALLQILLKHQPHWNDVEVAKKGFNDRSYKAVCNRIKNLLNLDNKYPRQFLQLVQFEMKLKLDHLAQLSFLFFKKSKKHFYLKKIFIRNKVSDDFWDRSAATLQKQYKNLYKIDIFIKFFFVNQKRFFFSAP
eukprot:TRINITY_DN6016_c0_g5_i3.p1 TRINITY_DN6016_c0_g5~~TRINITY_DN6016_c0_g5_i3.p1  ORF type:complete len:195 (+),score=8.57 TRINITY_DN6016_c0_g5_i3:59-586(+)